MSLNDLHSTFHTLSLKKSILNTIVLKCGRICNLDKLIHIFRLNLIKHIINLQHLALIVSRDISIKVWSLRFHLRKAGDMITKRITNKRSSWSMFPTGCTKTEKIYIKENNKKKKWKNSKSNAFCFFPLHLKW